MHEVVVLTVSDTYIYRYISIHIYIYSIYLPLLSGFETWRRNVSTRVRAHARAEEENFSRYETREKE